MGPTWVLSAPDGSHVGPMNLAIRDPMKYARCHRPAVPCSDSEVSPYTSQCDPSPYRPPHGINSQRKLSSFSWFRWKNTVSCDIFSIMARSTYVCPLPIPCGAEIYQWIRLSDRSGGRVSKTHIYELLNLRALKISMLCKNHIFQRMDKIFCVEFQRIPLKFHTKYLTHTLKEVDFIHRGKLKSSSI